MTGERTSRRPARPAAAAAEGRPRRPDPPVAGAAEGTPGPERLEDRPGREPGELVTGLSPRQIIGGFALVAGLIIWLRRRGQRKG